MLRTRAVEVSLWEAVLPPQVLRLPEELARVDALLDDPVFFVPFVPFFDPRVGRPSTPMETYLRMMFLKFRYRLGYESLCREVSDSITWRRFCRIPIDGKVPHPTTLMKLTTRCGTAAVQGCNEALLAKAADAKLLRTTRVRADTTVVAADVAYPTDSGLLAKAIRRIAVTGRRIQAAGGATRTRLRDRSRAAGKRAHGIAAKLRLRSAQGRDKVQATVQRITGQLAELAERDRIVDIDHDPTGVDAGEQGCAVGESAQEPRRDSIELAYVPEGELSKERSQRRGCVGAVKDGAHRPVPQQGHVRDAVRTGRHPRDQGSDLEAAVRPLVGRHAQMLIGQGPQAAGLRQRHHRDQPRAGHEIRVVKPRAVTGRMCDSCICEMPCRSGRIWSLRNLILPLRQGISPLRLSITRYRIGVSRLSAVPAAPTGCRSGVHPNPTSGSRRRPRQTGVTPGL